MVHHYTGLNKPHKRPLVKEFQLPIEYSDSEMEYCSVPLYGNQAGELFLVFTNVVMKMFYFVSLLYRNLCQCA